MTVYKLFSFTREDIKPSKNKRKIEITYRGTKFTDKQVKILELIAQGYMNFEIAEELKVSVRTVESHIVNIRNLINAKINCRLGDRELVIFAHKMIEAYAEFMEVHGDSCPKFLPSGYRIYNGSLQPINKLRRYYPVTSRALIRSEFASVTTSVSSSRASLYMV